MSPDQLSVVIVTAVIVLLIVLGALRVATAYRRTRRVLRRWSRTRLVFAQVARRRKGARRG